MANAEIIRLQRNNPLSFDEVTNLLPMIQQLTRQYAALIEPLFLQIDLLSVKEIEQAKVIEKRVNFLLSEWHRKVFRLGGHPRTLWTVEFDCGDGFYGWSYPDQGPSTFRRYDTEFAHRRSLVHQIHRMG